MDHYRRLGQSQNRGNTELGYKILESVIAFFFFFLQRNTLYTVKFTLFAIFDSCILQYNHYHNQDILVEWFHDSQDFLKLSFYSQSLNSNPWQPHTHSFLNLALSLSIMHLRFIHVIVCISNSFLFFAEHYFMVCRYQSLFMTQVRHWVVSSLEKYKSSMFLCEHNFYFIWINIQEWEC